MNFFPIIAFVNDGGGGTPPAGGDNQNPPAGNPPAGGDNQNPPPGNQPPAWKAPDGLPTHLAGATPEETVSKLWPAYEGARTAMAERGTVPKEAKAYELTFSDKAKPFLSNPENDGKVLDVVKTAMHKHGVTDRQSGFVNDLIEGLVDSGVVPKPMDPNEMWKSLAGSEFKGSDLEKVQEGQKQVREAQLFISQLEGQKGFTKDMGNELRLLTGSPAGMGTLKWLMGQGVTKTVQPGAGDGGDGLSKDQVAARRADPRNQYGNAKYDQAFALETERLYKALYPE